MESEEVLTGGNVAAQVVRVGATVRKPALPQTATVEAVLTHLAEQQYDGAPRTLGRDERGRHVLEYIPGVPGATLVPYSMDDLRRLGQVIRAFHGTMETFQPPADAVWHVLVPDPSGGDLICHNDLAPWNLIRDGGRWVFIDWDNAGPSSRLWELGYAALTLVQLLPHGNPAVDAPRLRALVDGYGLDLDQRCALPATIAARTWGAYDLLIRGHETGAQPWASLYAEGHADFWGPAADYAETHHDLWLNTLAADL
ncbi:hypothetical protein GCM10009804_69450 [Kribbella hippodromi]|uniref:Aminoglycoside phosphotransferase domain-containing protein n=1 Tax=Kribbella hippodromi TaxID=434347 RepID=A0ABN2ECL4_9ACTN